MTSLWGPVKGDKASIKLAPFRRSGETTHQILHFQDHQIYRQNFTHFAMIFCSHALVLFGGVQGLEYSLECDENLKADNVADLCDLYLNLCPGQGSRTIRTEVHQYSVSTST